MNINGNLVSNPTFSSSSSSTLPPATGAIQYVRSERSKNFIAAFPSLLEGPGGGAILRQLKKWDKEEEKQKTEASAAAAAAQPPGGAPLTTVMPTESTSE